MNPQETETAQAATTGLLGNDLLHWSYLLIAALSAFLAGKVIGFFINLSAEKSIKRGHATLGAMLKAVGQTLPLFGLVFGLHIGISMLEMPAFAANIADTVIQILFTTVGACFAWRLVEVATCAFTKFALRTENKMDDMLIPIIRTGLRIIVISLFIVQLVQVFSHQQVSSILAGLGIGGLAVALAAQDSIKNIFGSLVIIADKPFLIGERVIVDTFDGTVEMVGLRSTRIRTLDGHLVTIPNGELANKSIENVGRRPTIKRVLNVTVTYEMTPGQVARGKQIIEEIFSIGPMEGGRTEGGDINAPELPPRVYFSDFNDSSLNIIVIYWYSPADYWGYMAYSEWFNFELLKRYNAEGIDMAYPTQTLYLANDPKHPLNPGPKNTSYGKEIS